MHPAPAFLETDRDRLLRRTEAWPFAAIIGVADGRPHVAHSPVIRGGEGTLRFHLARMNPACQAITAAGRALIVFTGPNDYISPDWYGQEDQVPTWNYLSVEAEGPVTPQDEAGATRFLDDLSARFEEDLFPKPAWTRDKMRPGSFERQLAGITVFSLAPERLEGITKIGQNKPAEVRQRAGRALKASGGDPTISSMMERDS
ncbi:FMN-binding negative transcriptional regulator [Henriciella aquimarina]|uniref:FMN-binding negative transcriptional regulator n=1 Tax=Henriciella aquimarina TaxID=545261 RepID=UPI001301FAF1|nr:FMN-binding negative transcriptional regulator [Henriciella aquimarina]